MKTLPPERDKIELAINRLKTRNQELEDELRSIKASNDRLILKTSLNKRDIY